MLDFWKIATLLIALLHGNGINALVTPLSTRQYSPASRTNVAVYWGQGPNQKPLRYYCQQSSVDTIILSFMHIFPDQGNGLPGTNFGNQCAGPPYVFKGPGNDPSKNQLQSSCPQMVADIPICQKQYGKKILLSLGGATSTYQLTGTLNGQKFADFLWGAFGPQTAAWIKAKKPRPFDTPGNAVEVDGFDFDIEHPSTDNSAGYIALLQRLRSLHFPKSTKRHILTASPQCVVPDANMGDMIKKAQFDILNIQFYNTPSCSARSWVSANPASSPFQPFVEKPSGFQSSYNAWTQFLVGSASQNAKIYIGLPGSTQAVWDPSFALSANEATRLIGSYFCKANFGGVAIWEATYADNNVEKGLTFYQNIKTGLMMLSGNKSSPCYGK